MNKSDVYIDLATGEGFDLRGRVAGADEDWIRARLAEGSRPVFVTVKGDGDDDVEGHAASTSLRVTLLEDEQDTEGHAISLHFPDRAAADAFRRKLMVTGVLAGTLAIGAAGGAGVATLANQQGDQAGAVSTTISAAGMDWTQPERPAAAIEAGSAAGMDWTQPERPGAAAGTEVSSTTGAGGSDGTKSSGRIPQPR